MGNISYDGYEVKQIEINHFKNIRDNEKVYDVCGFRSHVCYS